MRPKGKIISQSSAGVNTPRLSINDLLEVVEEGRGLLQSSLSDFRLLKLLCLQKYTLNETLNFCNVRGTGSQIIDFSKIQLVVYCQRCVLIG